MRVCGNEEEFERLTEVVRGTGTWSGIVSGEVLLGDDRQSESGLEFDTHGCRIRNRFDIDLAFISQSLSILSFAYYDFCICCVLCPFWLCATFSSLEILLIAYSQATYYVSCFYSYSHRSSKIGKSYSVQVVAVCHFHRGEFKLELGNTSITLKWHT